VKTDSVFQYKTALEGLFFQSKKRKHSNYRLQGYKEQSVSGEALEGRNKLLNKYQVINIIAVNTTLFCSQQDAVHKVAK
jgi:hypothetical protein